jgi:hypothetical protein
VDISKLMGDIARYENDEMDGDEIISLFQFLVDTGMAWQLQGSYGRTARTLIATGHVVEKEPQS